MNIVGRTGRIGNKGLATAFYNERNSDLGAEITAQLIETNQVVPNFLDEFRPQPEDGQDGAADGGEDLMDPGFVADQTHNAAPFNNRFGDSSAAAADPFGSSADPFGSADPFNAGPATAKVAVEEFDAGW